MACHPHVHHGLSRLIRGPLFSGFLLLWAMLAVSQAAVTSDITTDGTLRTTVTRSGTLYSIAGGTRPDNGRNLFHSFDRFSVGTGDIAFFTVPIGTTGIANIVSRVTGGQLSEIDGRLATAIPGANLFLLNPTGVIFGPNAILPTTGSFHVSTADFLRFADGVKFFAHLGQESRLTVAEPAAFGFLGHNPAPITLQGSRVAVNTERALSVVGGDLTLAEEGLLQARSGRIHLASVASPGEVRFSPPLELAPDLQVDGFARLGKIALSPGSEVNVSSPVGGAVSTRPGAGTVRIRGGRFLVNNAFVNANTTGARAGAQVGIDIRLAEALELTNGGQLRAESFGAGRAGDVQVTAGSSVAIVGQIERQRSGLFSRAHAGGDAGSISVSTSTLTMDDVGLIQALAEPGSLGNAGDIEVTVGRLTLTNGAQIDSSTRSVGRGGIVTVKATDTITIAGRDRADPTRASGLFSIAERGATGEVGRVVVSAPTVRLEDGAEIRASTTGESHAGEIEVQVGQLTLTGGSRITSSSSGAGRGGTVSVTATDMIAIAGQDIENFPSGLFSQATGGGPGGDLQVAAPHLQLSDGGIISARSTGAGDAGTIQIQVGRLTLTGGGQINSSTTGAGSGGTVSIMAADTVSIAGGDVDGLASGLFSDTSARGDAGRITISAPRLQMDGGLIQTLAGPDSTGNAGGIDVQVGWLTLTGGAKLDSSTRNLGRGGDVTIRATEAISVAGRDGQGSSSGLFSNTDGAGPGGSLQVAARHLQLSDGGTISARSTGAGDAGTIQLQVGDTFLSENGSVTTATEGAGGGAIALRAGRLVQLIDSELTTSVRGGGGDAGNITIDPQFVILEGSQIIANAFEGSGGNILIEAGVFLADPNSRVEASSELGVQGTVDIRAPVTNLSGALAPLPQTVVRVAELLPARCTARLSGGTYSSLVLGGREGLPLDPGGLLPSPLSLDTEVKADLTGTGGPRPQNPTSRLALLTIHDAPFPRMRMLNANGSLQTPPELGCSKSLGERQADLRKSR